MARAAFGCTLGQSIGDGRFSSTEKGATPVSVALTAVAALQSAVESAQTAAEANATISGNGTALGLVQAIGTAFAAYVAAVGTASTQASACNAVLDIDTSVITTQNGVRAAVRNIMQSVKGSGLPS